MGAPAALWSAARVAPRRRGVNAHRAAESSPRGLQGARGTVGDGSQRRRPGRALLGSQGATTGATSTSSRPRRQGADALVSRRVGAVVVRVGAREGTLGHATQLQRLDVDQLPRVVVDGMSAGLVPFWPYKLRVRVTHRAPTTGRAVAGCRGEASSPTGSSSRVTRRGFCRSRLWGPFATIVLDPPRCTALAPSLREA